VVDHHAAVLSKPIRANCFCCGQCVLDFHTANGGWKRYEEKLTGGAVVLYNAIGYDVLPRETLTKVYTVAIDAEVVEGRNASRPYHIS
jgi:hypothetical protein